MTPKNASIIQVIKAVYANGLQLEQAMHSCDVQ
jgi:hypothetical protein